ncbi:hypothetical protein BABINDRAFT_161693 [Babjeviella inositovora NRRL Y-12698]|uniref:Kinetochore protein SPC25 n=1 Tax=Babjeviella inositovora NRRL Y-12698 TaxID=984486 RepID=A0A1E3QSR2_9ASCO|nr:uncharacterized protein BABINDRAFT_161693 [Babjeviella inositovora NRRL Y-12698]ODQ80052.1 hypothetical protein BABINDRAFT_161693 [Babjeviella inositovora NRRL Y-12698]
MSHTPLDEFELFELLKQRLSAFTETFEARLHMQSTALLNLKNDYQLRLNDLKTQQTRLLGAINKLKEDDGVVRANYTQDLADLNTSRLKIETLASNQTKLADLKQKLLAQISEINTSIRVKSEMLLKTKTFLKQQSLQNPNELYAFETVLAMRIDALANDIITFVWWNIDPDNYMREVSIGLDLSEDQEHAGYKISESSPQLDTETISGLESAFNHHRELSLFLAKARGVLKGKLLE